jgi:hypothetical protein
MNMMDAGMLTWLNPPEDVTERFERFAALVAAAEREACAAVARQWDADHQASNYGGCIANLIEARGQA